MKTYEDMLIWLKTFTPEQLRMSATVCLIEDDEFYDVEDLEICRDAKDVDVLGNDRYPIICIDA